MRTHAICFPFDLFGGGGTGEGAELLADELREVLADNRREKVETRARAYSEHVAIQHIKFDAVDDYRQWRERGRRAARQALRRGDFLLWITGNHLGALPVFDELADTGDETLVVQLDAHLDIHHFADCATEPSHGNFLLHCAGALPTLFNVGHRELLLTPEYVAQYFRGTHAASELATNEAAVLKRLAKAATAAKRVFLDLDCDVFDPAYFPAVARPVPFGLSPAQVLRSVDAVWSPKVAGVLLSEFDPRRDRDDRSLSALIWLIEYLLLRKYEGERPA